MKLHWFMRNQRVSEILQKKKKNWWDMNRFWLIGCEVYGRSTDMNFLQTFQLFLEVHASLWITTSLLNLNFYAIFVYKVLSSHSWCIAISTRIFKVSGKQRWLSIDFLCCHTQNMSRYMYNVAYFYWFRLCVWFI